MALTPDMIKADPALADLSDDVLARIATLSVNDEATVINTKVGELHGRYEEDIKAITGIDKKEGEKAYDYNKRVLGDYHGKIGGFSQVEKDLQESKTKITDLEKQIKEGKGNEALAQKLKDEEGKYTQLKNAYDTDKKSWDSERESFNSKISGIQIDTQFANATSGLKFKAGYPEGVQKTLVDSAKATVLAKYKTDFIDDGAGSKKMVFRDEKGEIVRNKANALNPYTAQELIQDQLKEVLDFGKKTSGGGTEDPGGKGGSDSVDLVDIAGSKTQVEADSMITKYLLQQGETRGSASFAERQKTIRLEQGVDKLPIR